MALKMRKWYAAMLLLFLMLRLSPAFAALWANFFSRPWLHALAFIGMRAPFSLLECGVPLLALLLLSAISIRFIRKIIPALTFILIFACMTLWYPLYFPETSAPSANETALYASCLNLICKLNVMDEAFVLPEDLPAKPVHFSEWMHALKIGGICSFLTGEALYSPDLEPIALPFVAVHERMHLEGYADEGAANIAAWEFCIARGGAYATSAHLWALRYSMGLLSQARREVLIEGMDMYTLQCYRSSGGAAISRTSVSFHAFLSFLGIEKQTQNYENLAFYLAADFPQ